jgi:hypothetical protein
MYVQYKDKQILSNYFGIRPNVLYVVLGIDAPLRSVQAEVRVLLVSHNAEKATFGLPKFVPLSMLRIVDDTPSDWGGVILHGDSINMPVLVHGFSEMCSLDLYIRIHDLDVTESDMELIAHYYEQYGGNIILSNEENIQGNSDYLYIESTLERYVDHLARQINDGSVDVDEFSQYINTLTIFVPMQLRAIEVAKRDRQKEILADDLLRVMSHVGYREYMGQSVSDNLLEVHSDIENRTLLIQKANHRRYKIGM